MKYYIVPVPDHLDGELFKNDRELHMCKDCYMKDLRKTLSDKYWCWSINRLVTDNDYCSFFVPDDGAERKEDA